MHERSHDRGEDDRIDPFVKGLVGAASAAHLGVAAPDETVEIARNVLL